MIQSLLTFTGSHFFVTAGNRSILAIPTALMVMKKAKSENDGVSQS